MLGPDGSHDCMLRHAKLVSWFIQIMHVGIVWQGRPVQTI